MPFGKFSVGTKAHRQFIDITPQARQAVTESAVADGILCLFNPHTTAGLTINEGRNRTVPEARRKYRKKVDLRGDTAGAVQ